MNGNNKMDSTMNARSTYSGFARFYDAYAGRYATDLPLYKALAARQKDPIIEVGCGSGRVLIPLLQQGYQVTGVDISPEMLSLARRKLQRENLSRSCKLCQHNFYDGCLNEKFNLALVTFYTFNYLSPDEQGTFLDNLGQCLNEGAVIALHLFCPLGLSEPENVGKWVDKGYYRVDEEKLHLQDCRIMLDSITEERQQVFTDSGGKSERIRTLRYYISPLRIAGLLSAAGFTSLQASTDAQLDHFTVLENLVGITDAYFVIAEKRA